MTNRKTFFFLLRYLKNVVYKSRSENIEEMKERIAFKCEKINKKIEELN